MKDKNKIVLLVALALFLMLSACTRQASTAPVAQPTPSADVSFPVSTPGQNLGQFGTQTAIASTPAAVEPTAGPEVNVVTLTPAGGDEAGGGQGAPAATATSAVPAPAQPVVTAPPVTRPANYTLQRGEWPICIARRYDLDLGTFFQQNGLSMASKPAAGTVLKIPSTGNWDSANGSRALKQHPTTYTVGAGDSIYSIACSYGDVAPEQILAVNNIKAEDVKAGMTLNIP